MTENSPPKIVERLLDANKFFYAQKELGFDKYVFLAGPFININGKFRKNTRNTAAALRHYLFHKLTNNGWNVTMGEYQKLINSTKLMLGSQNNSALAEIYHAKDTKTHAIVLIASSPGSFLELGAFAGHEQICNKMLVIIDYQYKNAENYMNSGPVIQAKKNGAKIKYINYLDKDLCWAKVEKFMTKRQEKILARMVQKNEPS